MNNDRLSYLAHDIRSHSIAMDAITKALRFLTGDRREVKAQEWTRILQSKRDITRRRESIRLPRQRDPFVTFGSMVIPDKK